MVALTADDNRLLKDVGLFIEPIEVYDAKGKLLGLFVPANLERGKELYAQVEARIDRTEINRRKQSDEKGEPFEIVLERLRKLEAEIERRKSIGECDLTRDEALAYFRSLRDKIPQIGAQE